MIIYREIRAPIDNHFYLNFILKNLKIEREDDYKCYL